MSPMTVAAPTGSPMPSIMSSRLEPEHVHRHLARDELDAHLLGDLEELLGAGHAVLLGEAAHHPRPHPEEVHLRQLPVADARALHRRHHLLHPVLASDPLVVPDEGLEAPERHEDAGLDAHRRACRGEDHRRPGLLEITAVIDDEEVLGLDLGLLLVSERGCGGGGLGRFGGLRPTVSGPDAPRPADRMVRVSRWSSLASLPTDDEAVDRAVRCLLDELVAGGLAPRCDVLDRTGVGREQLDGGPRRDRSSRPGRS